MKGKASAQNVFLKKASEPGTLLTIDYGTTYNYAGFVKLALTPDDDCRSHA